MADLSTKYLGLQLKNPFIAASSSLTSSVENIKKLENAGIAAVVLKSIFEEEILLETKESLHEAEKNSMIYTDLSETLDYIDLHVKEDNLAGYLNLIRQAKDETLIPVIASINCITSSEWTSFAKEIEQAGADALELNIFLNPSDLTDSDFEETYRQIIKKVLTAISIPVAVKISQYFTKVSRTIQNISNSGVAGIVLFNRFYSPDIDLEKLEIVPADQFSSATDYLLPLRWTALMSGKTGCDLAASTGIHSGETALKLILAGASAVEIASVLYKNGIDYTGNLITQMDNWMEQHHYNYLEQLKGKFSQQSVKDPAAYERMQFMRHFSGIE